MRIGPLTVSFLTFRVWWKISKFASLITPKVLQLRDLLSGTIIISLVSSLMLMVADLDLRLGLVMVESYVMMLVSSYQVFSDTLMVLLTSFLLNYMLFTRAFCLLKT